MTQTRGALQRRRDQPRQSGMPDTSSSEEAEAMGSGTGSPPGSVAQDAGASGAASIGLASQTATPSDEHALAEWEELKRSVLDLMSGPSLLDEFALSASRKMIDGLSCAKQREVALFLKRQGGLDFDSNERYINVLKRMIPDDDSVASGRLVRGVDRGAATLARYLEKATKFDGSEHCDIQLCEQDFRMNCDLAGVNAATALSAVHMVLGGAARQLFIKERNQFASIGDVWKRLRERFVGEDQKDSLETAWTNLSLDSFRREHPDEPDTKLLERLMATATTLQNQLDRDLQSDKNLLITLKRAVKGESFSRALWYNPPKTSQEAITRLKLAASAERVDKSDTFWTANRYERKKNRTGRDGKTLKCNICSSEWHLMRACPKATVEDDVRLAELLRDTTVDEAENDEMSADASEREKEAKAFDTHFVDSEDEDEVEVFFATSRGAKLSRQTMSLCVDTGAPRSVVGLRSLEAYKRRNPVHIRKGEPVSFRFGQTVLDSIGVVRVRVPTDDAAGMVEFDSHVVNDKKTDKALPFLMGMDALEGVTLSVGEKPTLKYPNGDTVTLTRKNGHLVSLNDIESFYTMVEATKLHRRFGHLTGTRVLELVKKADPTMNEDELRELAEKLGRARTECRVCEEQEQKPLRPAVAARWPDEIRFNHTVIMDVMFSERPSDKAILQMICKDTGYTLACYVNSKSAKDVTAAFLKEWVTHTSGLPEVVKVDMGTEFVNMHFVAMMNSMGVCVETAGIEGAWQMGRGEQAHGPLKQILNKLKSERSSSGLGDDDVLGLATKAMNDSMNADGLVPTLLVFGCTPRTPIGSNIMGCPDQRARMEVMRFARTEYEVLIARRRLSMALSSRYPAERVMKPGDRVKVYRFRRRLWEGPYALKEIDYTSNVAVVDDNGKNLKFSVAVVRPYREPAHGFDRPESVYLEQGQPEKDDERWDDAKRIELEGLERRHVWDLVPAEQVPHGSVILRTKWVLKVKPDRMKARLTVLGNMDKDKELFVSNAPTLRTSSVRMILMSKAERKDWDLWVEDADQAFLQSLWELNRDIYVVPPREWTAVNASGVMWKLRLPLYGLVDAPTYWSKSILSILTQTGFSVSTDPCLFTCAKDEKESGFVGVYVDDLLLCGDEALKQKAALLETRVEMKQRIFLRRDNAISFAGMQVREVEDGLTIKQTPIDVLEAHDFSSLRSLRGKLSWLVNGTRADLNYLCAQLMQVTDVTYDQTRVDELLKRVKKAMRHWDGSVLIRGLRGEDTTDRALRIEVFADAAFANNQDLSSQLGYIVCVVNDNGHAVPLLWGSKKARRITRSVLGAEILALAEGFDAGIFIQTTLRSIGMDLPLGLVTDSRSIFDAISTDRLPAEKRLALDISVLREAFKNEEVVSIKWVRSEGNPADGLTKAEPNKALLRLLKDGTINLVIEQQIKQSTSVRLAQKEERLCELRANGSSRTHANEPADEEQGAPELADVKEGAQ
ncbi:Retrovirus-related Pol polyprotein from transposon TNT 1-94 [Porphyridium purpureum]|uniref:Retrovirus-related Pol polyprotein from transposon TNT 1-94 n=1 Tax=Porphyridium purpureum TaxID=35688 RepID=A0A5J4YW63_PORPP|nr:Retrovirus-related Pol polyprotein from transposon TNT 1-94 [Porphyridium purpureum]|eukprot:POR4646..scf227_4